MSNRALGIDVGAARFGVAVGDTEIGIAHPRETVSADVAIATIVKLAEDERADTLVIGLPLEMDGSEGAAVRRVRKFESELVAALADASLVVDIEFWDERLTTTAAQAILIDADVSRRRRKEVVDKIAAAHILQGWLDSQG